MEGYTCDWDLWKMGVLSNGPTIWIHDTVVLWNVHLFVRQNEGLYLSFLFKLK